MDRLYEAHTDADPCVLADLVFDARFRRNYIAIDTQGGLLTTVDGQVLHADGGLYASGNCSAAVLLPTYPGPGATLGPAMVFACRAVEHLSRYRD